jgi:nuclear transport factor 2 (NTF2) superfamily protein
MLEVSARQRVRASEDAWNLRNLDAVVLSHTIGCQWRCRADFIWGRDQVRAFVSRRWRREIEFRLLSELWAWDGNRIAMRFACEFRDDGGIWYRVYGNENWLCDEHGLVSLRLTNANEHPIEEYERTLRWTTETRPADYPTLIELGF